MDVVMERRAEDVQKVLDCVVDEVLETALSVREAQWHDLLLEMAISCAESGFPLLYFCDR